MDDNTGNEYVHKSSHMICRVNKYTIKHLLYGHQILNSVTLTNRQPRITVHSLDNLFSLDKEDKKIKKVLNSQDGQYVRHRDKTNRPTWFSTTQLGSIWASPSGSKTTVWYSLKSVSVTSAFSGQTSMVSTMVSLSKSFSQTLPTPSP